ncbi:MAG: ATP-binding cassette domain-containing protein [Planctomycetaceae bacterium]|nr:ATP-binding cassette domain-containing protein [Planctomycetaceae bacterium]
MSKSFATPGGRVVCALSDVNFALEEGQILSILGHNGSGKTTLLNCVRQVFSFDAGEITVAGSRLNGQRANIVSVFQDVSLGVVPSMTAFENLALAKSSGANDFLWSFPATRYQVAISEFLREADLEDRFDAYRHTPVAELSGGQRQQLALLMAMVRIGDTQASPAILCLDEFVANLDPVVKEDILGWSRGWIRRKRITTIMVTHDHALAERWGDLVLELTDGRVTRFSKANNAHSEVSP